MLHNLLVVVILLAIALISIGIGYAAQKRGRSYKTWFTFAFIAGCLGFLGIFALLIVLFALPANSPAGAEVEKKVGIALLVLATVGALAALVVVADRATRRSGSHAAKVSDGVDIAEMAPDFTLKDLNGNDVSLAQYRGKVILVNFWATWCDPCRVEIPWLIEMQEKYGPRGFTVLGIAMDEEGRKAVEPYVQKERFTVNGNSGRAMNYPILIGNDAVADKFGGLIGFPTSVLISKDGRQVKRITGLISYDEVVKAIESLL